MVCVFVKERFVNTLKADGLQVDRLKNDVNLSGAGPYYLGINITDLTVSVILFLCQLYV